MHCRKKFKLEPFPSKPQKMLQRDIFKPKPSCRNIIIPDYSRPLWSQVQLRAESGERVARRPGETLYIDQVYLGRFESTTYFGQVAAGVILSDGKTWQEQRRFTLRTLKSPLLILTTSLVTILLIFLIISAIFLLTTSPTWLYCHQGLWFWKSRDGGFDQRGGGDVYWGGESQNVTDSMETNAKQDRLIMMLMIKILLIMMMMMMKIRWKRAKGNLLTLWASSICQSWMHSGTLLQVFIFIILTTTNTIVTNLNALFLEHHCRTTLWLQRPEADFLDTGHHHHHHHHHHHLHHHQTFQRMTEWFKRVAAPSAVLQLCFPIVFKWDEASKVL